MYSEARLHNINTTSWNKPWPLEINWLDSHVNLSNYPRAALEGLTVGYKITKYAKYFTSSKWGCIMMFKWDAQLADSYYLKHYANTNRTMVICTPHIPMRPDHFRNKVRTHTLKSMVICNYYQLGYLKWLYQQGDLGYIWRVSGGVPLRVALVVAGLITITGVVGECCYGARLLYKTQLGKTSYEKGLFVICV